MQDDKQFFLHLLGEPQTDIKDRVEATIDECLLTLSEHFNRTFVRPTVTYDLKGRTAGIAKRDGTIRLNITILNDPRYTEDMIENTLPHEVAHIVQRQMYPTSKSHGWEWQTIMLALNKEPTRCHNYETVPARQRNKVAKPHAYTCNCMTHMVSNTLHRRILQGQTYNCTKCKGRLK